MTTHPRTFANQSIRLQFVAFLGALLCLCGCYATSRPFYDLTGDPFAPKPCCLEGIHDLYAASVRLPPRQ
jgi:hypothetical protein